MEWVQHQLQASGDITDPTRLELIAVLDRLKMMDPSNDKAVVGWRKIRDTEPKEWRETKPVRDALIGEAVKKALEGGFSG